MQNQNPYPETLWSKDLPWCQISSIGSRLLILCRSSSSSLWSCPSWDADPGLLARREYHSCTASAEGHCSHRIQRGPPWPSLWSRWPLGTVWGTDWGGGSWRPSETAAAWHEDYIGLMLARWQSLPLHTCCDPGWRLGRNQCLRKTKNNESWDKTKK